jgi:hypothetical protein
MWHLGRLGLEWEKCIFMSFKGEDYRIEGEWN